MLLSPAHIIRIVWGKLSKLLTCATLDSWSFARSPRSPNSIPLKHSSLTQASISSLSLFLVFPPMNSNSSWLDFESTGSITWPNLRANSRIKILSSTCSLEVTQGTGVHLSCGKTFFWGITTSLALVLIEFWTCAFFSNFAAPGAIEWGPGGLQKCECLS